MKKINISLNIGMIYQCNMNQDFGIIVSLYGDKLYYSLIPQHFDLTLFISS